MNNLAIYELAREVPNEAKKTIAAGRLKGMTDINPMYRIKKLTELFGPCGVGWWYEITNKQLVPDATTNQVAAFVDILLYYVDPESGVASRGIPGTGGACFVAQERNGPYMSDECHKMALTDAISVAAKALGIGANVYWEKDRTKYSSSDQNPEKMGQAPRASDCEARPPLQGGREDLMFRCAECGEVLKPYTGEDGKTTPLRKIVDESFKKFGQPLCPRCQSARANAEAAKPILCQDCGQMLIPVTGKDGKTIAPASLADYALRRFGRVLCPDCQSRAHEARKRAARDEK